MTAQELRAQADSLAAQALHGDLFSSPASEAKIQELRAQARALETETVSETETETVSEVEIETETVSEVKIPAHDDDDLMSQWREVNRAGDGQSFGDPDDLACEIDIYDSAEIEGAQVLCGAGEGYLVRWLDDYYLVCDANGWWACRVTP